MRLKWVLIYCTEVFTLVRDMKGTRIHCLLLCWSSFRYLFWSWSCTLWISHNLSITSSSLKLKSFICIFLHFWHFNLARGPGNMLLITASPFFQKIFHYSTCCNRNPFTSHKLNLRIIDDWIVWVLFFNMCWIKNGLSDKSEALNYMLLLFGSILTELEENFFVWSPG